MLVLCYSIDANNKTKGRLTNIMNNTIIAQTFIDFASKIFHTLDTDITNNIGEWAKELNSICEDGITKFMGAYYEALDHELKASTVRKSEKLKVKESGCTRAIGTSLGCVEYKRTYYQTDTGKFIYLLDYLIGVEPYERLDKELCADLVNLCSEMSFQKVADFNDNVVSRQTINNKLLAMDELVADVKEEKIKSDEIHIFVDEGHTSIKTKKGKRNVQVPIATVTGGVDTTNSNRHKLINPLYLASYYGSPDKFFDTLYAITNRKFDLDYAKNIYIHSDAGAWIKTAKNYFCDATFVMDEFHLEKHFKKLSHYCEPHEISSLRQALKNNLKDKFFQILTNVKDRIQDRKEFNKFEEEEIYFRKNWNPIITRVTGKMCGSCTEPIVSHLFAERISRNPGAWTPAGLQSMTMLRAYKANGCKVTSSDINVSRNKTRESQKRKRMKLEGYEKYENYIKEESKRIAKEVSEYYFGHLPDYVIDTTSGTQKLLSLLGTPRMQ